MSSLRTPRLGSAVGRLLLLSLAVMLLVYLPENIAKWDDPDFHASRYPMEDVMPRWFIYPVFVALAVGIVMLGWGWVARRRRARPSVVTQGLRVFAALVLALWSVAFFASQVVFMMPEYTPEGDEVISNSGSLGYFVEGFIALIMLVFVAVLARDGVALSRVGARAQVEAPSKTG